MRQQKMVEARQHVFRHVVTISEEMQRRLETDGMVVDKVIYNGTAGVEPRPPFAGSPTILFVGRLASTKGSEVLLRVSFSPTGSP